MVEPTDLILPKSREIRAGIAALDEKSDRRREILLAWLDKIEDAQQSYRQATVADTLMSKPPTGEFEERIEALERKERDLEAQR